PLLLRQLPSLFALASGLALALLGPTRPCFGETAAGSRVAMATDCSQAPMATLEVPQPGQPATPAVPDAPVTPIDPDPGTPAAPEGPADVPAPEEPATPVVPEPSPDDDQK